MKEPFENLITSYTLHHYYKTGNPLFVWKAYQVARESGGPIPEETLFFLDHVAKVLLNLAENPPDKRRWPDAIQNALSLSKPKGKFNEFKKGVENFDGFKMAIETHYALRRRGPKETKTSVYEDIGDRYNLSKTPVEDNYKKWEKEWKDAAQQRINGTVKLRGFGRDFIEDHIIEWYRKENG